MSDPSSKPAPTNEEKVTVESNEKHHHPILPPAPTLAELAERRKTVEAVQHPETPNARPTPVSVDPRAILTSTEVITMELQTSADMPYVLESNTFETLVNARRNVALRLMQDLDMDIQRLELEISQRQARRNDLAVVVARADAALGIDPNKVDKRT